MTHHSESHVLAEISVEPVVQGSGHGDLVKKSIGALDGPELTVKVGGMSTIVEGDIDDVLHAIARAHNVAAASAERVVTSVRIESKLEGLNLEQREANTQDFAQ